MMAANEARQLGYGGVSMMSRVCGLSRVTITKGMRELRKRPLTAARLRHPGGGRPTLLSLDPELSRTLEGLVEPLTRGDSGIAAALDEQEHACARGRTHRPAPSGKP